MKRKITICILSLIIILVIGIIFSNSLKSQVESSEQSVKILNIVLEKILPNSSDDKVAVIHNVIRKTAHAIEYMCLGIAMALFSRILEKAKNRKYICLPLLIGLSVGVIDEFIQSLNDRSSEVRDVMIDFGGVAAGVLLITIIFLVRDFKKKKKEEILKF